jgi:diguanylate cyclase (GGDEF)-like protein
VVQPETLLEEQDLVEMVGAMLGAVLRVEMQFADEARRVERVQAEALSDELTGLFNRRGWSLLLDSEEERCRRYGHSAAVLVLDLDGLKQVNDAEGHFAGDQLLLRTAAVIKRVLRSTDVAARLGGDEFTILAVECNPESASALLRRLRDALATGGISASIGLSLRHPVPGLLQAWHEADRAMYVDKRLRVGLPATDQLEGVGIA